MNSAVEIMETLDDCFLRGSRDPELLDVLCYFKEQGTYGAVGDYIMYLRIIFKHNPESLRLSDDYIKRSS